jgi:phosphoribosyl 1,2-cyclic phosphodiesterase
VGDIAKDYGKTIYATKLVHEGIACNRCLKTDVPANRVAFLEKGKTVEIGNFRITPFDVPHDSRDCVGYVVEADGVRFCLITDVGHVTDTIREQVGLANYLVLESNHDVEMLENGSYPHYLKLRVRGEGGHLSNDECADVLKQVYHQELKHVFLCHLSADNNTPDKAFQTASRAIREKGGIVGIDGVTLVSLPRTDATMVYQLSEK